jgi:hypothetical protein
MNINPDTKRVARSIGGAGKDGNDVRVTVQVPQPFAAGPHELTEGEANALNQIVAENLSNNLRAKIVEGQISGEGDSATVAAYTDETAQALVDEYLAEYELGVRRAGSGERQVTDPVEREARKIARAKAVEYIKSQGGKPSDFDMPPIVDAIFEANRDTLMKEGRKIVDAANKAAGGLDLGGIQLTPKAAAEGSAESASATADAEPELAK